MTTARFCPACGTARLEGARFCGGCGEELGMPGVPQMPAASAAAVSAQRSGAALVPPNDDPVASRRRRRLLATVAVLVLLVGVGLGAYLVLGRGSAPVTYAGVFTPTGSMTEGRVSHTATLLPNGRVLIAGGGRYPTVLAIASADVYDPVSGTFNPTGPMATARTDHTATLLRDGLVLIAGGWDGSTAVSSAELYDPTTGTFKPTQPMGTPRAYATATLLADGRVLIAGDSNNLTNYDLSSAELYDPMTGTFSPTGSMAHRRSGHTATMLPDGRVLVAGGSSLTNGTNLPLSTAELYDPATGAFSATGSMATPRWGATLTLLPDGTVLLAGGMENGLDYAHTAAAELFDPRTGTFSATGSMAVARGSATAILLADGRVLIAGGADNTGTGRYLTTAELYDPSNRVFRPAASMTKVRAAASATLLTNGWVLITGGASLPSTYVPSAEVFQ